MKIAAAALILALIAFQDTTGSKDPRVRPVFMKLVNAPISAIVAQLQEETGIPIEFGVEAKKSMKNDCSQISIDAQDVTLYAALQRVFLPRNLKVVSVGKRKILITTNP
ncbi:MAG TPA: hypothetical protein VE981_17210 [Planctomycetota bacterium]|nr:hypothetical protein [Planctomycetota bacterium]